METDIGKDMDLEAKSRYLLGLYGLAWAIATPGLYASSRIREGWRERLLKEDSRGPVHLWIQASSGGEAYLALEILKTLDLSPCPKVLVTSGTTQGLGILEKGLEKIRRSRSISVNTAFFPFDRPYLMTRALGRWKPRAVVLLETELWPALMAACRKAGVPVVILNGRLSQKSFKTYRLMTGFWHQVRPDMVLAVSGRDRDRYGSLFGPERVKLMHNIKFDRMPLENPPLAGANPLCRIIPDGVPFLVLGSVRREEEDEVLRTLKSVAASVPEAVGAVFPRHMHRIPSWKSILKGSGLRWFLRSDLQVPPPPGTVILCDVFGELASAYALAQAAFVGGTLKPCGGQNFLEAIGQGVVPSIGPHWEHFSWVGREIVQKGLVQEVGDWKQLARVLVRNLREPVSRELVLSRARAYVLERQGGTAAACRAIVGYLQKEQSSG